MTPVNKKVPRVGKSADARRTGLVLAVVLAVLFHFESLAVQGLEKEPAPGEPRPIEEVMMKAVVYGVEGDAREAKRKALEEMNARAPEALAWLMRHIHIENLNISILADNLVTAMKPEECAPILASFLKDERPQTRKFAAWFLGYHVTPSYAGQVALLLDDEKARNAAIRTLGKWQNQGSLFTIAAFIRDEKERTRVVAVNALRDIGNADAIPFIREALDDKFFTVRKAAERALAELKALENP